MSFKNKFTTVFKTPFFEIQESDKKFGSEKLPYFRYSSNDSVIASVFDTNGDLILVEQFRNNLNKKTIEFPAGEVNENETIDISIEREVKEETGYECKFIYLGAYRLMLNRTNMKHHVFIGFDAIKFKSSNLNEAGMKPIILSRKKIRQDIFSKHSIEQLAAFGILFLIEKKFGINIFDDTWLDISEKLRYTYNQNDKKK